MALLEVHDLHVSFPTMDGVVQAVRGVSFSVDPGKTLGIVGESGSGKSVSTQTIMGLTRGARDLRSGALPGPGPPDHDRSRSCGRSAAPEIAMIFQDPLSSLHPYYRVGWQIVEMIRAHERDLEGRGPSGRSSCSGWSASRSPTSGRRLSASVLGRHAPAGHDRHGHGAQPRRC